MPSTTTRQRRQLLETHRHFSDRIADGIRQPRYAAAAEIDAEVTTIDEVLAMTQDPRER